MSRILGIDEAGRGPVIGSLFMAGVIVETERAEILRRLDIRDSKTYGSSSEAQNIRRAVAQQILDNFSCRVIEIDFATVNRYVMNKRLNSLERETAKEIIDSLEFDLCVLDGATIFSPLTASRIIAENKADRNHLSVAAASVLAKDARDTHMRRYAEQLRQFYSGGGGYPNQRTLSFVLSYYRQYGVLPPQYRIAYDWKCLEQALETIEKEINETP